MLASMAGNDLIGSMEATIMSAPKRSYREEQQRWGITTALQMLMLFKYTRKTSVLTFEDVWDIARMFDVEDDLKLRLSARDEHSCENCKEEHING